MISKYPLLDKVASTRFQREVQQIYDSLAALEKREEQGTLGELGEQHKQRLHTRLRSLEEGFGRATPGDMGTRTVRPLGAGTQSIAFQTVGDVPVLTKILQSQVDSVANKTNLTRSDMMRGAATTGYYTPGFHAVKVTPPEYANLPAFSQTLDADGKARNTHPRAGVAFDPPESGVGAGGYSKATPLTPEHIIRARQNINAQFGEGAATTHALMPYNAPNTAQQGVVHVQEYLPHESVSYKGSHHGSVTNEHLQKHLDTVNEVLSKLPQPATPKSRSIDLRGVAVDVVEHAPSLPPGISHSSDVLNQLRVAENSKGEYRPNTLNASAQVRGDHNFGDIRAENIRRTHDGVPKLIDAYDFTHEPLVVDDINAHTLRDISAVEKHKALGTALRGAAPLTDAQRSSIQTLNAHTHAAPWKVIPHETTAPKTMPPSPLKPTSSSPPQVSPHPPQSTNVSTHSPPHTQPAHAQTPTTPSTKRFPWGLVAGLATPLALGAGAAVLNHYTDRESPHDDERSPHQKHAAEKTRGLHKLDHPYFDDDSISFLNNAPEKDYHTASVESFLLKGNSTAPEQRLKFRQNLTQKTRNLAAKVDNGVSFPRLNVEDLLEGIPEEHWSDEARDHINSRKVPKQPSERAATIEQARTPPQAPIELPTPPVVVSKEEPPAPPPVFHRPTTPPVAPTLPPPPPTSPMSKPEEPPPWKDPAPASVLRGSLLQKTIPPAQTAPRPSASTQPVSISMIAPSVVQRAVPKASPFSDDSLEHLDADLASYYRKAKERGNWLPSNFVHLDFDPDPNLKHDDILYGLADPELTRRRLNLGDNEKVTLDRVMHGIPREHWSPELHEHLQEISQERNDSLPEDQRFRRARQDGFVDDSFTKGDERPPIVPGTRGEDHLRNALGREVTVRARNPDAIHQPPSTLENLQIGDLPESLFTPQERSKIFRTIPKTPPLPQNPLAGDPTKPFRRPIFGKEYPSVTNPSKQQESVLRPKILTPEGVISQLAKEKSEATPNPQDPNALHGFESNLRRELLGQGVANQETPISIHTPQEEIRQTETPEFIHALGLNRPVREREAWVDGDVPRGHVPEYFDKMHPKQQEFKNNPAVHVIFDQDKDGDYTKRRGASGFTGFAQSIGDAAFRGKDPDQTKGLDHFFLAPRLSPGVLQWAEGTPISTQGEVDDSTRRNLVDTYHAKLHNFIGQSGIAANNMARAHHELRSDPRVMAEQKRIVDLQYRRNFGGEPIPLEQTQFNEALLEPYKKFQKLSPTPTQADADKIWTETVARPFLSHAASRGEGAISRLLHPMAAAKLQKAYPGSPIDQVIGLGEANLAQNRYAVSTALLTKEKLQRELEDVRQNPHLVEGSTAKAPDGTMSVPGWFPDRSKHNEYGHVLGENPHAHLTQEALQPILDTMRSHAESSPQTGASKRTLEKWEEFQASLPKSTNAFGQNAARSLLDATPDDIRLRLAQSTELHSSNPQQMEKRIQEVLSDHMRGGYTVTQMPADIAQRQIAAHKENTLKNRINTVDDYIKRREASFGMNVDELVSLPLAVQSNREINPAFDWMAQAQRQQRRVATEGGYYNPYSSGLLNPSIVNQPTPLTIKTDFPSLESVKDKDLYTFVHGQEKERAEWLKNQYGNLRDLPNDEHLQDSSIYTGDPNQVWFHNNVAKTYAFPGEDLMANEVLPRTQSPYQNPGHRGNPSKAQFQPLNLPAESRENVEKLVSNLTPQQIAQAQQQQELAQFQQESQRAFEAQKKLEALEKYRAAGASIPQAPTSQSPPPVPPPAAPSQPTPAPSAAQSPTVPPPQPRKPGEELPPHHIDNPDFMKNIMESLQQKAKVQQAPLEGLDPSMRPLPPSGSKPMVSDGGAIREATEEESAAVFDDPELNMSSSDRSAASGMSPTNKPLDYSKLTPEQFKQLEDEFARGDLDPKRFGAPPIDPNNKDQVYEHFRKHVEEGKVQVHPDMAKAMKGMTPEQFKQHMEASEEVMETLKEKGLENIDPAAFAAAVEHAPHLQNVENLAKHMEKFKGFEKYIKNIGDVLTSVAKWFKPKVHNVLEGTYEELQPQNHLLRAISTHQHTPLEGTYEALQPDQGIRQSMIGSHNIANSNEVLNDPGNLMSLLPSELGLSPAAVAQHAEQEASKDGFWNRMWKSISTPKAHNVVDPASVIAGMESQPDLAPSALLERLNKTINKIEIQPKHLVIPGLALGALGGSALYDYWKNRGV